MSEIYKCPECGSEDVTTEHHEMFMVNSGAHYCHSMKPHDTCSPSKCLSCGWVGLRRLDNDRRAGMIYPFTLLAALNTIACELRDHPEFLGEGLSNEEIAAEGGEAAFVTNLYQIAIEAINEGVKA